MNSSSSLSPWPPTASSLLLFSSLQTLDRTGRIRCVALWPVSFIEHYISRVDSSSSMLSPRPCLHRGRWATTACISFLPSYTGGLVSSLGCANSTVRNVSDWLLFRFLGHGPGRRIVGYMVILSLTL